LKILKMTSVVVGSIEFHCAVIGCDFFTHSASVLMSHHQVSHFALRGSQRRRRECRRCALHFTRQTELRQHIDEHHSDECLYKGEHAESLLEMWHVDQFRRFCGGYELRERPRTPCAADFRDEARCTDCGQWFASRENLAIHDLIHLTPSLVANNDDDADKSKANGDERQSAPRRERAKRRRSPIARKVFDSLDSSSVQSDASNDDDEQWRVQPSQRARVAPARTLLLPASSTLRALNRTAKRSTSTPATPKLSIDTFTPDPETFVITELEPHEYPRAKKARQKRAQLSSAKLARRRSPPPPPLPVDIAMPRQRSTTPCPACRRRFKGLASLRTHLQLAHDDSHLASLPLHAATTSHRQQFINEHRLLKTSRRTKCFIIK
jgi:hypothetical protein